MTLLQKIETSVFLWVLWALAGCASLTPAQQARLDLFECRVHAFEPVVSPALDAAHVVADIYRGQADLSEVLGSLRATQAEVKALQASLDACEPKPVLPVGTQSKLVAPPPAYGNKIL